MRALLLVVVLGVPAARADTPAKPAPARLTIDHATHWGGNKAKPIAVRISEGAWRTVPAGKLSLPIDVIVPTTGRAVALDVLVPGMKAIRRWGVLVPGADYRMVGNACAFWGLDTDGGGHDPERVRLDATQLPASAFPLIFTTAGAQADTPGDTTAVLDKPGMSAAIEMHTSAMCPRSGVRVIARSRASKQPRLDETVIAQPGRLHTITLTKAGFDVVVEPQP